MAKDNVIKTIVKSLISTALLLTMLFTCPDREKHVKAMSNHIASNMQTEMGGGFLGGLVYKASDKISGLLINNELEYRNLWLLSIGFMREESDISMFSIGAFGKVAVFGNLDD